MSRDLSSFTKHVISRIAGRLPALVFLEVTSITAILADDHQVGIEVALPQVPRADLVGVVGASIAVGGIYKAVAGVAGLAFPDEGGVSGKASGIGHGGIVPAR